MVQSLTTKKRLTLLAKVAVSLGLIGWLVLKVDISLFMRQVEAVVPWLVAASVVLIFLQITLGGVRWWVVMRALTQPFPIAQALAGYYIGNLASQILPGAIAGDAVRIWCARRTGLPLNSVINSVVLERFVTVLGLALVVTALQPVLLARVSGIPGSWVFPALTVAGILGGTVLCVLDRLPSIWQRWRLVRGLVKLAVDTRRLFVLSPYGLLALAIAIISQGNLSFSVWVLAHGLGLPVSFLDCMVLVPPVILVMTVPISIAGWGVRETAMVVAFGFIGLNGTSALALSLFFGLTTLVGALLGGIFFLLIKERGVTIPPNIAFLSEEP